MIDIDKLINTAKDFNNQEFPFSDNEIRSIMENCENSIPNKPNSLLKRIIKMTTICAGISAIIFIALQFINPVSEQKIAQVNSAIADTNSNNLQMKFTNDSISDTVKNEKISNEVETENGQSIEEYFGKSNSDTNLIKIFELGESASKYQVPIYTYTPELGKALGIKVSNKELVYDNSMKYNRDKWGNYSLTKLNYPDAAGIMKLKYHYPLFSENLYESTPIPYTGWDMSELENIYPVYFVNQTRCKTNSRPNFKYYLTTDKNENKYRDLIAMELDTINKFLFSMVDISIGTYPDLLLEIGKDDYFYSQKLFAVIVPIVHKGDSSFSILWYPRSKEIFEKLPKQKQETKIVKQWVENDFSVSDENYQKWKEKYHFSKITTEDVPKPLYQMPCLELTQDEAKELNLFYFKDSLFTFSQYEFDKSDLNEDKEKKTRTIDIFTIT